MMFRLLSFDRIESGCDDISDFLTFHRYDDSVTMKLVGSVKEVLGVCACVRACACACVCFRVHIKRQQAQSSNISKHPSRPTSINLNTNTSIHTLI